jgi:hypothetical protein
MEGRVINIRRLVALDVYLHGPRFILTEFGAGTPAIIAVGLFLIRSGQPSMGAYLVLTGINYVPLLVYAVLVVRARTAAEEIQDGMSADRHYVRRYSVQQLLIFVPLAVFLLAVWQELARDSQAPAKH